MIAMAKATDTLKVFSERMVRAGGELLAPTNPFEVLRFRTLYGVGVVWQRKTGKQTWSVEAKLARDHIRAQKGSLAPVVVKGRGKGAGRVQALFWRDGANCFFCGHLLADDITVEHLVAIAHGGPNHISNLFLAHEACNQRAGHLSAPEKVAMAIRERGASAICPDDGNLLADDGVCGFCGNAPESDQETCLIHRQPVSRCPATCDHGEEL